MKKATVVFALILTFTSQAHSQTSIVGNGSFETPAVEEGNGFITLGEGDQSLYPWVIESGSVDLIRDYWRPASDSQSIDLEGYSPENGHIYSIYQDVATTAGTTYELQFAIAGNPDDQTVKSVEVFWGDTSLGVLTFENTSDTTHDNMGYLYYKFPVVAQEGITRIKFVGLTGTGRGVALDDVSLVPVQVVTPQQQIQTIVTAVDDTVTAGTLKQGQASSLSATLKAAIESLAKSDSKSAKNQLNAFANQVSARMRSGMLTQQQGQQLLDAVNAVVSKL
jgi:choice-of-anchor C domain-containing protein